MKSTTPNIDTGEDSPLKLLINNCLLEQEKRITTDFRKELDTHADKVSRAVGDQSKLFNDQILQNTRDISTLFEKVKSLKTSIATVGASAGVAGSFVGFIAGRLIT